MIDLRLRSVIPEDELEEKVGKVLTRADFNVLLTGPTLVRKPDGSPLCVYRPGIIPKKLRTSTWPILSELRHYGTFNRGKAAGMRRQAMSSSGKFRETGRKVASSVVGTLETKKIKVGGAYCRLTAWSGTETEKFRILWPLLEFIGKRLRVDVPERWEAQMEEVRRSHPDWIIPGTPFSTVTVNNTYETGVHQDKGDLDAGFSTLAVFRRGDFAGGVLVFPEYRVGVDMQDGDLLLMDAHAWHGNTWLEPRPEYTEFGKRLDVDENGVPRFERISVVSYFRTKVADCGAPEDEAEKARAFAEQRNAALLGE